MTREVVTQGVIGVVHCPGGNFRLDSYRGGGVVGLLIRGNHPREVIGGCSYRVEVIWGLVIGGGGN